MEQFKPKKKLISASAGTGKTYTLIQEISKVLETTEPSKIVAITFTKAATRDIRSKVHEKFAGSNVKDMDEININTIHGFFTGILREQSIYFKHSTNFNILEQFDDEVLFTETATELLLKKASDPQMEKFFVEYQFEDVLEMLQKLEKRYAVVRDKLDTDPEKLFEEERKAEYKALKKIIPDDVKKTIVDPMLHFKGADTDKLEQRRVRVVPFVKDLAPVTDLGSFYKMVKILKELPDDCAPGSAGKATNWNDGELEMVKSALRTLSSIKKEAIGKYKLDKEWMAKEAAQNRKVFFELFLLVHAAYMNRKKELDVLSYNDIEIFTYDLVKNNPKVAEFYRKKYDHIFVDEFQDTNMMQRDVLFAIAKEIFLVGDAKQSIYRFRNADVRVFMNTQASCSDDELLEIKQNRRCLPSIIDTVNKAFPEIFGHSHSEKRMDFEAEYLDFECVRKERPGCVRFINAPSTNSHHNSFNHKLEAEICLDLIRKGISDGKSYRDFAMLFRNSGHMVEFERLFREKGIPFIVYGGGSRDDLLSGLRSLFSVILDPYDDYSMLEVLKLPSFYVSDEDIYRLKNEKGSIWENLKDEPVKKFILEMRKKKDHGSFTEFVAEVLRSSKFLHSASLVFIGQDIGAEEAILSGARHVESEGEGIEYFLEFIYSMKEEDMAKEIDAVKLLTVHASKGLEFNTVLLPCLDVGIRYEKDNIVVSENGDVAVKLGDDESNKKFNTVLYHETKENEQQADIAESKRVFYVAMTRAMDELYLISDFNKGGKGIRGEHWVDWIAEVFKDKIEEYPIGEGRVAPASRRKIVRTIPVAREVPVSYRIQRRWTVSQVKDSVKGTEHAIKLEDEEDVMDATARLGNIIHSIFENWHDKEAVEKIYQTIGDPTATVKTLVDRFVLSGLGKKLFSAPKFLSEHSFAVKINDNIVSGRIDRINIYDDNVWVVDYKTTIKGNELEGYKAQLACYLKFAEHAFPGKKIMGSLIDINLCKEYAFGLNDLTITI